MINEHLVNIISVGQIRPEKNHLEQLRIFAEVKRLVLEDKDPNIKRIKVCLNFLFKIKILNFS